MFEEKPELPPDRPLDPRERVARERRELPSSRPRDEADYELVEEGGPAGKDGPRDRRPRKKKRRKKGGRPAKGVTLSGSKTAAIVTLSLGGVLVVLAFVMLGVGISSRSVATGVVLMLVLLLCGAGCIGIGVYLLWRNLRLVLGSTSMQLVQKGSEVVGQVPYDNIVMFQITREHVWHMGAEEAQIKEHFDITLHDHKRKDTWWTVPYPRDEEYSIRVTNAIRVDPTYLQLLLKNAMRAAGIDVGLA